MAVNVSQLLVALRLGDSIEETAEATRLLAVAQAVVAERAPDAPDAIKDEAVIRIAAFLYDKPYYDNSSGYSTILRNSGAGDLLLPFTVIRAVSTGEAMI